MTTGMGNPLLAVADAIPPRIAEAKEERDKLIARVLELNHEIARLETICQVAPVVEPEEPEERRRHRDAQPAPVEA